MDEDELNEVRKKIGILFQSGALFNSMTVGENVALPLHEHTDLDPEIIDIMVKIKLELVGLREHADKYPAQISGGMKKRAGLARALALDPDPVLRRAERGARPGDERADRSADRGLSKQLGVTSVVVTHEMDSAFTIADRMAMLDKGQDPQGRERQWYEGCGTSPTRPRGASRGRAADPPVPAGGRGGPDHLREEGGPLDDLSGTLDNANSVTMEFRASWEEQWSGDIDAVITSGRRLFEQDLADRMEQIRALLDDAQGYMSPENRDNFANILERGSGFADDLDGRIKDSALGLLDAAKEAVNDAKESIIDFAREEQPNVRKMLANMRLSTDQLRNTMVEVRRAPWRLLYRPGDRELNFELLYDSARSYAEAVSDLRAASESLRVVAGDATPGTADARRVETLTDDVGRAYERYQEAEARFFELLRGEG
jgi:energy-coupling factor transporter ATP-binding protein EcfA2